MTNKEVKANIKEEVTLGIFFLECNACDKKLYNEGTEISSVLCEQMEYTGEKHNWHKYKTIDGEMAHCCNECKKWVNIFGLQTKPFKLETKKP